MRTEDLKKVETGTVVATRAISLGSIPLNAFAGHCLMRHQNGDWGDICEEDAQLNNASLDKNEPGRLFSSYNIPEKIDEDGEGKLWIITEWDRSVTTILYPSEY